MPDNDDNDDDLVMLLDPEFRARRERRRLEVLHDRGLTTWSEERRLTEIRRKDAIATADRLTRTEAR